LPVSVYAISEDLSKYVFSWILDLLKVIRIPNPTRFHRIKGKKIGANEVALE
jgi:hypothetical protein